MPTTETSNKSSAKKTASAKKAVSAKKAPPRKAASSTRARAAAARAGGQSVNKAPPKIKRLTVDDLFSVSPEEALASPERKAARKLDKLDRTIIERGGRGITIGGEPAPGTPEDTRIRIDRGIVKPIDL